MRFLKDKYPCMHGGGLGFATEPVVGFATSFATELVVGVATEPVVREAGAEKGEVQAQDLPHAMHHALNIHIISDIRWSVWHARAYASTLRWAGDSTSTGPFNVERVTFDPRQVVAPRLWPPKEAIRGGIQRSILIVDMTV